MPTGRTGLAGWVESINETELYPLFLSLVPHKLLEHKEVLLGNSPRKVFVLHHSTHVQVFHDNSLWIEIHYLPSDLMRMVPPDVCDSLVAFLHSMKGSSSIGGTFPLPCQSPLFVLELSGQTDYSMGTIDVLGFVNLTVTARYSQSFYTQVNPDRVFMKLYW